MARRLDAARPNRMDRRGARRSVGTLIAVLLAGAGAAVLQPSAQAVAPAPPGAAPESVIDAPAYVRPPRPAPGALTVPRVRIG